MTDDDPLTTDQGHMQRAWSEWAANAEICPVCQVAARPVRLAGGRWGVAVDHDPGCVVAPE